MDSCYLALLENNTIEAYFSLDGDSWQTLPTEFNEGGIITDLQESESCVIQQGNSEFFLLCVPRAGDALLRYDVIVDGDNVPVKFDKKSSIPDITFDFVQPLKLKLFTNYQEVSFRAKRDSYYWFYPQAEIALEFKNSGIPFLFQVHKLEYLNGNFLITWKDNQNTWNFDISNTPNPGEEFTLVQGSQYVNEVTKQLLDI